jgi:hypothetical protein
MSLAVSYHPNAVPAIRPRTADGRLTRGRVVFTLVFRLLAFAAVQALIAAAFALGGRADPWSASVAWWPLVAVVVSLLTGALLIMNARREGLRYADLLNFQRGSVGRDILWAVLIGVLVGPVAYFPMLWLSDALYGDPQAASALMFRPLPPGWAAVLFVAFPLVVALTELPAYFGYVMPRLEALDGRAGERKGGFFREHVFAPAVLWPAFFLAAQHAALPLILDWRFIVWRLVMFLPFALVMGVAIHWRPRLLPYFMIGHFLIDLSSAYFFLALS